MSTPRNSRQRRKRSPIPQYFISSYPGRLTFRYFQHFVSCEGRHVGVLFSKVKDGVASIAGAGMGPRDAAMHALLQSGIRPTSGPEDKSQLRIICCSTPKFEVWWRRWPGGRGEVWVASSDGYPFKDGRCYQERVFLALMPKSAADAILLSQWNAPVPWYAISNKDGVVSHAGPVSRWPRTLRPGSRASRRWEKRRRANV